MSRVDREETEPRDRSESGELSRTERELLQQLRAGDAEAGRCFVRDFYPGVYRYLLLLSGRPELAEDLTQEAFLQAWRHLDQFAGRSPLRVWLHRIAHREFLQALRHQRSGAYGLGAGADSLADLDDAAVPVVSDPTETVVLREVLRRLPVDEREVMVLHYLHDHSSAEIARIIGVPAGTVRYWLARGREKLRRELGEGDLPYLNEASVPMREWAWLPLDQMHALETRWVGGRSRNPVRSGPGAMEEENMERREFLRHAAVGAAGLMLSEPEKEIVDDRLTQKVSCAFKGTALSDLCEKLKSDTGVQITAGPSVADEKVALFCEKLPLREVMRQLSRPFGYTWLRSGTPRMYRYELVQDLRSQLLEEELRNRDRNAALLALDRDMQRYRPYLDLSPDDAQARARTTGPEEKSVLERLSGKTWGAIQMYYRLTPNDLAALWTGQSIKFSADPQPGEQPLPADLVRGVLQSWRDWRVRSHNGQFEVGTEKQIPDGQLPASVPEARVVVTFRLDHSELGEFSLQGGSGILIGGQLSIIDDDLATGVSQAVRDPENAAAHAKQSGDPALRRRITVAPDARRQAPDPSSAKTGLAGAVSPVDTGAGRPPTGDSKVTTADVLEALHRASGLPIIADFYTHLYPPSALSVQDQPLFDALNQLADAMHLRWNKEVGGGTAARSGAGPRGEAGDWLQFRSASFFNDRLKEVPNRLLSRWSTSRRQHGASTLDDLIEIAQLTDAQLDSRNMAEGARECWGLAEWDLARNTYGLRPHLRFMATLTPAQRQQAMGQQGLAFTKLSLSQQQQFIALALESQPDRTQTLEELGGALLRVDYTTPGWFQWQRPAESGEPKWQELVRPPVRERAREAALQAARRLDPQAEETQIAPTELAVTVAYLWGRTDARLFATVIRATPTSARRVSGWREGNHSTLSDITRSG